MAARNPSPRITLFAVVGAAALAVIWQARHALWPFGLALALAYLIAPLVTWLHQTMPPRLRAHRAARPLAILTVYACFVAVVVASLAVIVPPVSHQAGELLGQGPELYLEVEERVLGWLQSHRALVPPQAAPLFDRLLDGDLISRVAGPVLEALQSGGRATVGAVYGTISWLLGLVLVPIWLVYILDDPAGVRRGLLKITPRGARPDVDAVRIICDRVLSAYIRGQLLIAVVLGTLFTLALFALGVPYALLLGIFAGVMAVIPFIGSVLGALAAIAVAFVSSARLALLVALAFIAIQQVDNMFISPRFQGRAVALNPAAIMVVVVIGQALLGPIGLLIAVPATAALRDVVHFAYLRLGDDRPSAAAALMEVGYGDSLTDVVRGGPAAGG